VSAPIDNRGVGIAYDVAGGREPTLLLCHGISNARTVWDDLRPALAERHRVVRMDFRGHGASDRAPGAYRLADYASDVVAVIETLGLAPVVIVGHSLGGLTAAYLAARRPELVRGLFLIDPPLYLPDARNVDRSPFPALFTMLRAAESRWQAAGMRPEELGPALARVPSPRGGLEGDHRSPEYLVRLAGARLAHDYTGFDPVLDGGFADDWNPDAISLACPVRVIAADPALGPAITPGQLRRFARAVPQARIETYAGTTHMVQVDEPARIAADVLAFAAGLDASG
jgi:pimeloyl-ACP methyl ester carboxylesterase